MAVTWHEPFSNNIRRVGHDPDSNKMFVEWRSGKTSAYGGVSADKFDTIRKSTSVTNAINSEVKPWHDHSYLPSTQ